MMASLEPFLGLKERPMAWMYWDDDLEAPASMTQDMEGMSMPSLISVLIKMISLLRNSCSVEVRV